MENAQIDLSWTLLTSRAIPLLRLIVLSRSAEWCAWFWFGGSFGLLLTATAFVRSIGTDNLKIAFLNLHRLVCWGQFAVLEKFPSSVCSLQVVEEGGVFR